MRQIHFIPWLGLDRQIVIGPVTLSPWPDVRAKVSPALLKYLDAYFSRYVDHDASRIEGIAIAALSTDPVAETSPKQRAVIRRAVDALLFSSMIPPLRSGIHADRGNLGLPRSERFQLVTQLLGDTRPFVAVLSGGVLHTWPLDLVHFCPPWHVGSVSPAPDGELLDALGRLLNSKRGAAQRERIFRSIEWFRLAHTGSDETTDASRVVMMATAFEVLLEPSSPFQKRSLMAQALHKLAANKRLRTRTVQIAKARYRLNMPAVWLDKFYQLRNAIVHGDRISPLKFRYSTGGLQWLTHLHVADLIAWEVVAWELVNRKLLGTGAKKLARAFARFGKKSGPDPVFVRHVTGSSLGIHRLHSDLSWTKKK